MKKLIINKPEIIPGIDTDHCRMSALIESDHFSKDLYFEVENRYKEYLCAERGDAFMLSLLHFAMSNGYDMDIRVPVSEKLYYQITEQYIPTLVKYNPKRFNNIGIKAPISNKPIANAGAVGASASGGIDSLYSIIKNTGNKTQNYNVNQLMIASVYNIYYGEEDTRKRFSETVKNAEKISHGLGIPLVSIFTNEHEFWFPECVGWFATKFISFVYALQKLFSVYHFSAGYEYENFSLSKYSSAYFDFFTAQLVSSENLTIYSSGQEASRIEKAMYISDNPYAQKLLQVCNFAAENCCTCPKCIRSQLELWSIGKLDNFRKAFPKSGFEKYINSELIKAIGKRGIFDVDLLKNVKKNGLHIPLYVKIAGNLQRFFWYGPKKRLKKINFLCEVYKKIMKNKHNTEIYAPKNSWLYFTDKDYAAKCDKNMVV